MTQVKHSQLAVVTSSHNDLPPLSKYSSFNKPRGTFDFEGIDRGCSVRGIKIKSVEHVVNHEVACIGANVHIAAAI